MAELGKWMLLDEIGGGGQGTVYKAVDTQKAFNAEHTETRIGAMIKGQTRGATYGKLNNADIAVLAAMVKAIAEFDECFGALKQLKPEAIEKARERMAREIKALSAISHGHLAEILDHDVDQGWFVTRYYKNGPLSKHMDRYKGDAAGALKAVRGVVHALAGMWKNKLVHRDVKPDNIFVADDGRLVLGDLGLVFPLDAEGRLSSTAESAGTADWMAPWAHGQRLEDISPKVDVFGIGKVLYCMIAGRAKLVFWYHKKKENDLEKLFRERPGMARVNRILNKCIVEEESQCKYDEYAQLLGDIDSAIESIALERREMPDKMGWTCRVCGQGKYEVKDYDPDTRATAALSVRKFGLDRGEGIRQHKIGICKHCGHVELFAWRGKKPPPAWGERSKT